MLMTNNFSSIQRRFIFSHRCDQRKRAVELLKAKKKVIFDNLKEGKRNVIKCPQRSFWVKQLKHGTKSLKPLNQTGVTKGDQNRGKRLNRTLQE